MGIWNKKWISINYVTNMFFLHTFDESAFYYAENQILKLSSAQNKEHVCCLNIWMEMKLKLFSETNTYWRWWMHDDDDWMKEPEIVLWWVQIWQQSFSTLQSCHEHLLYLYKVAGRQICFLSNGSFNLESNLFRQKKYP